jgi:two-component system sensor histidine kinase/response regulator
MARKRILLIGDDQVSLESLREVLEQAGYETIVATDGHQGLALAQSQSPDLLLLDLLLPGPDSLQICRSLKEDPRYADIPIVMLAGAFVTQADIQRSLEVDTERYVLKVDYSDSKSLTYDQLLRDIRVLLDESTPPPVPKEDLILVADDDGLNRSLLEQTLSGEGYSVVTAADGKECWVQFQSCDPILVLLDVNIPELNGLEVLRQIRDQTADVAVVMITACGSEEVAVESLKQGADDYLVKPLQPWQVLPLVKENLEKVRLRRFNRQLVACLRDSNLRLLEKHRALQTQNAELQEAYQRLQNAEQVRQSTVGMMVHDLKNPLSVLLLSLDLLVSDFGDVLREEQREILRSASMAGQQMLHLVTNMLEVQRLEDGKMPVRLQGLDLALALRMTVRQAQPLADQKNIALLLQVDDTLPHVRADVDLTSRVVANLLDNAIKFTPPDEQISVTAEPGEKEIIVCVTDSGPGIPADQQTHIFGKFAQVELGPYREKGSVGLGLAFCKLAVEAQEGRIWVESEPGQGSQFKFALPVWREDPGLVGDR